ncbi:HAD-IIIA family hydrolase [candidate division KSB1 bacterium]|nr:HAD-IIIA family hydrolase [candidate division KSB1 bacterium]
MSSSVERNLTSPFFVFLDRDGTVIEEKNYLSKLEDIAFIPGSEAAVARLNRAGVKVVVISNQSGVGRGYFTEAFVQLTHEALRAHLAEHGAHIDAFYFCPHAPEAVCTCRKPRLGMLEQAARDFKMELRGVMIGDRVSDLETGENAGLLRVLVRTGYGEHTLAEDKFRADFVAEDLSAAVEWILRT